MLLAWACIFNTLNTFVFWMFWDAAHGIFVGLICFPHIHFSVYTRGYWMIFWISKHFFVGQIRVSWHCGAQYTSLCNLPNNPLYTFETLFNVWDTFQCMHRIYVGPIFMTNMLTSNNNMWASHVYLLELTTITSPLI